MDTQTRDQKISPSHPEVSWDELETPGFYVSRATGNGYRVPAEALIKGASPVIQQVSAHPSQLVKISENPFIPLIKARTLAANCNIEPNFWRASVISAGGVDVTFLLPAPNLRYSQNRIHVQ